MRVNRTVPTPAFEPITITLDSLEEAQALKVLCTTTAEDAVIGKYRRGRTLAVSPDAIRELSVSIFPALQAEGITYLEPK